MCDILIRLVDVSASERANVRYISVAMPSWNYCAFANVNAFKLYFFSPKIFSIVFSLLISIEMRSFDWSSENNVILFSSSFINFMMIVDRLMGFCCCWQCLSRCISIVVTFFRIGSPNLWVLFDVNKNIQAFQSV